MTEVSEFHSDVGRFDVHIIFADFGDKNVIYTGERVAKLLINYNENTMKGQMGVLIPKNINGEKTS